MPLDHENITGAILAAGIAVHRMLGPGFIERGYHRALCLELRKRRVAFETELRVPILYEGVQIGLHRLDLLVERLIVVELKAVRIVEDVHFAVVKSYLRAARLEHGLILNFARTKLDARR